MSEGGGLDRAAARVREVGRTAARSSPARSAATAVDERRANPVTIPHAPRSDLISASTERLPLRHHRFDSRVALRCVARLVQLLFARLRLLNDAVQSVWNFPADHRAYRLFQDVLKRYVKEQYERKGIPYSNTKDGWVRPRWPIC